MYKLLLVTDREDMRDAFESVQNWREMMFYPATVLDNAEDAVEYLESNGVDAVGYSLSVTDAMPLSLYLATRPSLPVFQPHRSMENLIKELHRVRAFLDKVHADYADDYYDETVVMEMLRDEMMASLLSDGIEDKKELESRMKLVRSSASLCLCCYLFDFDLPQGEVYLQDRWHYGRERLAHSLRNNFFGKYVDHIYYDVAVLTPRHVRVVAIPAAECDFSNEDLEPRVRSHVQNVVKHIKKFLDLDLHVEQYTVLPDIFGLLSRPEEETK